LGWLCPCPEILKPDWKGFPRTNTLAYKATSSVTKKNGFITLTPGWTCKGFPRRGAACRSRWGPTRGCGCTSWRWSSASPSWPRWGRWPRWPRTRTARTNNASRGSSNQRPKRPKNTCEVSVFLYSGDVRSVWSTCDVIIIVWMKLRICQKSIDI